MPIREKMETSDPLDASENRLASRARSKKDEDHTDFSAAMVAMLPAASTNDPPAIVRTFAAALAPIATSKAQSGPEPVTPQAQITAPKREIGDARPGFWSGLLRAAEGLIGSGQRETALPSTRDNQLSVAQGSTPQAEAVEKASSPVSPSIVALARDVQISDPGYGLSPKKGVQQSSSTDILSAPEPQTSWLQLVEAVAPLGAMPELINQLNGRHTLDNPTTRKMEMTEISAIKASPSEASNRTAPKIDQSTVQIDAEVETKPTPVHAKGVDTRQMEQLPERPSLAAKQSQKAATHQTNPQLPVTNQPSQSRAIPTEPAKVQAPQRAEFVPSAAGSQLPFGAAPQREHTNIPSRPIASTTPINHTPPLDHRPASSHTATLRVDLVDGASAHARIRERAGEVEVEIVTNNQPLAHRLDHGIGALRRNLDASGLQLQSADVSYRGENNDGRSNRDPERPEPPRRESGGAGAFFSLSEAGK